MPLPEDEALHVVRVLRMGEGDRVRLIDGRGSHALGTLVDVGKRKASVTIKEVHHEETRPQGLTLLWLPPRRPTGSSGCLKRPQNSGWRRSFQSGPNAANAGSTSMSGGRR